jgi:hypothetical protein
MSLRPFFAKLLGSSALLLLFAVAGSGCDGCSQATVTCDQNGKNCVVCDGYGCHPADPQVDPSGGTGGAGGQGQGGSGQGGGSNCDPQTAACPCATSAECPNGTECLDGLCLAGCNFSYECGPGKVCANGKCEPGCDAQKPCGAGYVCDKGVCQPDPGNPACDTQNPCPSGEICVSGLCTTGCTKNADCGAGKICDSTTASCIPDPSPTPGCSASEPCPGTAKCMADGYCHYPCATAAACKLIDNRFVACDQGYCKTQEEVSPECSLDKPCPAGKDCISNKCL